MWTVKVLCLCALVCLVAEDSATLENLDLVRRHAAVLAQRFYQLAAPPDLLQRFHHLQMPLMRTDVEEGQLSEAARAGPRPPSTRSCPCFATGVVCVFTSLTKLSAWVPRSSGGHVLRETTSRDLCGLVWPSRISERGGKGDCVKEGGGEVGERVKERARAATMTQPSTLRLIRYAAVLAGASPTLLFSEWKNAMRLKWTEVRLVALRWHASGSEVRLGFPVGL